MSQINNLTKIINSCNFLLQNYHGASECRDYINNRISNNLQEKFEFGYFPNIQNISLLTSLIDKEILFNEKFLFTKSIEDSLFPRELEFCYFEDHPLVFPFKNTYGEVVGIVGRTLLSEQERKDKEIQKYKNNINFNKNKFLFGLYENKQAILKKDSVYIVEGQFDVIKSMEAGLDNVVAIGSANISLHQIALIKRYTNNIFLLLDNDEAGEKGRYRTIRKYSNYVQFYNSYIPLEYKDIADFFKEHTILDFNPVIK